MKRNVFAISILLLTFFLIGCEKEWEELQAVIQEQVVVSNDEEIQDINIRNEYICIETLNPKDVHSMLRDTTVVLLLDDVTYRKTIFERKAMSPVTIYDILKQEVLCSCTNKPYDELVVSGGVVTKEQFNNADVDYLYTKKIEGPKARVYLDYYMELVPKTKYLVLAHVNQDEEGDRYYVAPSTIFTYDKESDSFINEYTGIVLTEEDIERIIKTIEELKSERG